MVEMIEIKDGLVSSPDNEIIKARESSLFPDYVQHYTESLQSVSSWWEIQDPKINKIYKVSSIDKIAYFKNELIEYVQKLKNPQYFLSNIPIPGGNTHCYPLIVKYQYGIVCIASLDMKTSSSKGE